MLGVWIVLVGVGSLSAQTLVPTTGFNLDEDGLPLLKIESDPGFYYVLEAAHSRDTAYTARSLALGSGRNLVLTESLEALPESLYRVRAYPIASPGDQDGDGVDDLTEHASVGRLSPFNTAKPTERRDGAVALTSDADFAAIAITQAGGSTSARPRLVSKIYLVDNESDAVSLYFINVKTHPNHVDFARATGIPTLPNGVSFGPDMRGTMEFHPDAYAPNGARGLYTFYFGSFNEYSFELIERAYEILAANLPFLRGRLAYRPYHQRSIAMVEREQAAYDASRVQVISEEELYPTLDYLALNAGIGFGRLRRLTEADRPSPYDIVVYAALPNELPRVGGILTEAVQTPLSHVNLRAIQDSVPNAFLRDAFSHPDVLRLEGQYVRLEVRTDTFTLRAASVEEVDAHFAKLRPDTVLVLKSDLTNRDIVGLRSVGFAETPSLGAKSANLAELHRLGFPDGTIPEGFAVPYAFYDDFMRGNGFDREATALIERLRTLPFDEQEDALDDFRKRIRKGEFSAEARAKLTVLQQSFPVGQSIRCRSSSNGEDLPGFNGAGLYDSKTQHPDEGHIEKSIRQVYASLWTYRAYAERDFYRIDHASAKMGVTVHPNYTNERVNGVAVSIDPRYGTPGTYYVNAQVGEDLVTNPSPDSKPEELLLTRSPFDDPSVQRIGTSSLLPADQSVLDSVYIEALREAMTRIHDAFAKLYQAEQDRGFAMEIEFKVDEDGVFAIKQARPWVGYAGIPVSVAEVGPGISAGSIFPNPTRGGVTLPLKLDQATALTFAVYDALGHRLRQAGVVGEAGETLLELPSLADLAGHGPLLYVLREMDGRLVARGWVQVRR